MITRTDPVIYKNAAKIQLIMGIHKLFGEKNQ